MKDDQTPVEPLTARQDSLAKVRAQTEQPRTPAALRDDMRRRQLAGRKARRAARAQVPTERKPIGKGRRYAKPKGGRR